MELGEFRKCWAVLTMMSRSACVPVKTGMSIGTRTEYGLFSRTPKLRSPLRSRRIKTPMCIKPTRAARREKNRKTRHSEASGTL